jgi:hypothetical protein
MNTYTSTFACARARTHTHTYIHKQTHTHTQMARPACAGAVALVRQYYDYMHTHINRYTHTHTHTHTQMATPTCAGAVALVRQYYREGWHISGNKDTTRGFEPSAALLKATMIQSGRKMQYQNDSGVWQAPPERLPHSSQGYGRVDLSNVLWFGGGSSRGLWFRDQQVISQGQSVRESFTVRAGTVFKVSLVWTDPPGTLMVSFWCVCVCVCVCVCMYIRCHWCGRIPRLLLWQALGGVCMHTYSRAYVCLYVTSILACMHTCMHYVYMHACML